MAWNFFEPTSIEISSLGKNLKENFEGGGGFF
jgi:hypothetical protein